MKLDSLINNLPNLFYRVKNDKNWTAEYISEGCYKLTGYKSEEFINKDIHLGQIILEEDRDRGWHLVQEAVAKKEIFNIEYRIKHKNGTIKHFWEQGQGIYDSNDLLIAIEGFVQDITKQKEIEYQLRDSKAKYKALLEAMPDMLFIQDLEGVYTDSFTPKPEQLFMSPDKIIGKNMKDILPAHVYDIIKNGHDLAIASGGVEVAEYNITNSNGEHFFEARMVHLNQHGVLTIVRDITERKLAKSQFTESEHRNKAMLQAIPDFLYVLNKKGMYLSAHAPDNLVLPEHRKDLVGLTIHDILPNELCERIMKSLYLSEETKETQFLEYSFLVKEELHYYEARIVAKDNGKFLVIVRDITERRVMDDMLYLRNKALEAASSGIIITDARQHDNPIIYINEAFEKTTGYQSADFIGKNCRFLQGDDLDQEEIKIMSSAIKNGDLCNVVLRNYRKDGSLFWNEVSLTPIFNKHNVLTHFIGVQRNVTARKEEEFFKNAIQNVMDMIIQDEPLEQIGNKIIETIENAIPNSIGSILLLNKEKTTLHKLSAPHMPPTYSKSIDGIEIGEKEGSCGTAAFLKEEIIVSDIATSPLWEKNKKLALENDLKACWSFPIFSSNKEVLGTFAIFFNTIRVPLTAETDIIYNIIRTASLAIEQHNTNIALERSTDKLADYAEELENEVELRTNELKHIVQKLTESNLSLEDQIHETKVAETKMLRNKFLLDNISQNFPKGFIVVIDSDIRVEFMAGEELEELGFSDLVKKKPTLDDFTMMPKEILVDFKNYVKRTFKGEHCSFEVDYLNKTFLVNTTPLMNDNNKIKHVLFVYNNITLQKSAELNVLNSLKKEQELSELKSRFISMASHEFRTPLSAILSSAILIEKLNAPGKEEKRINHVSKIRSNVKNLVVILNDFLSLSKLQEGKVKAQPSTFDFIVFSKSIIQDMEGIKKRGQKINIKSEEPHIEVYLDSKLMQHIIFNLLSNALKYSDENTTIIFEIETDQQQLFIEITDQGIGIPKEEIDNMFQRFYRANNTTNIQGTGLGLNIVKEYTELMEGSIKIKSELHIGSTFYVTFPLNLRKDEKNTIH
ncbi:PAS domain S-box protein [Winogradskyella ludwigii]|uniref:PAS domain S-box protein n=1 Tax=Winogradskyella ludwigii TaxID=2686076 RepID=UPI0015C74DB9|nr:PAS domain S-box protein [Winogradskyella ludwigii]